MVVAAFGEETEERMRDFYECLNEKDRQRYAGLSEVVGKSPNIVGNPPSADVAFRDLKRASFGTLRNARKTFPTEPKQSNQKVYKKGPDPTLSPATAKLSRGKG